MVGRDPSVRALLEIGDGGMLEASPDLGLPAAIEGFNSVLEARFARGSKCRYDAEQQAHAHDSTDDVGELMRSLEDRGIVELGVGGQTKGTPATQEQLEHVGSHDRLTWPAGWQPSVNGDAVEH